MFSWEIWCFNEISRIWCFREINLLIFTKSVESGDFFKSLVIFTKSLVSGDFLKNLVICTGSLESGDFLKARGKNVKKRQNFRILPLTRNVKHGARSVQTIQCPRKSYAASRDLSCDPWSFHQPRPAYQTGALAFAGWFHIRRGGLLRHVAFLNLMNQRQYLEILIFYKSILRKIRLHAETSSCPSIFMIHLLVWKTSPKNRSPRSLNR